MIYVKIVNVAKVSNDYVNIFTAITVIGEGQANK